MNSSIPPLLPLVVLVSGNGSNLQAIMDACATGQIAAEVRSVISNEPSAYALQRAQRLGIATEVVSHRAFNGTRRAYDRALAERIDAYQPGLILLAGFMRILTIDFVEHFWGRMLNIHPALLPDFRGLHTHARALASGVKEHGATVHFVTVELDGGPIVIQARVPILPHDTEDELAARVLAQEHLIYPLAVSWFAQGHLQLTAAGQVVLHGQLLPPQGILYSPA